LEHFRGHGGLKDFNSFGALKGAVEYLEAMLNSPPESHEIRQQWGNRFAGGSKDNPFLKPPEERFTSYCETIAPQKICKGIMEIREQLAAEWIDDLSLIPQDNAQFIIDQQKNQTATLVIVPLCHVRRAELECLMQTFCDESGRPWTCRRASI
jgi:hypothetical protein